MLIFLWDGGSIDFIRKREWNKLVEYDAYLLFMIKMKYDSYRGTYENDKLELVSWRRGSTFYK